MSARLHLCAECGHQSADHAERWTGGHGPRVGPCSMGGCACALTPTQVEAANPAVDVPDWPACDHAAGRWVDR